ncbi:MAG: outer membrane beta-barrel protein [Myxococcota bacterium]
MPSLIEIHLVASLLAAPAEPAPAEPAPEAEPPPSSAAVVEPASTDVEAEEVAVEADEADEADEFGEFAETEQPSFREPSLEPTPVPDPRAEREAKADAEPDEASRTWGVGASVDVTYAMSTNFPRNHVYRGMVPTPRLGEISPSVAAAWIDHMPTEQEPWRLELLVHAGAGVDALIEPEPVPGGDNGRYAGAEAFKHIGLANAGVRLRSGTTFEAGLLPAPMGLEAFWPNRNSHQTVSWTANGTPFYLMGAQVKQELPAGFEVFGWVVNGWQTMADLNSVPSYVAGLSWSPRDELSASAALYFGPDDVDISPEAWRVHGDANIAWNGKRLGLAAVWDAGRERLTTMPGSPVALWTGGGLFARGTVVSRKNVGLDLAARPEAWWDRDGRIYGVPQWLVSATGTASLHLFDHLTVRTEYRYDHSTAPEGFFYRRDAIADDADGLARHQHIVLLSLAGYFRHAFAVRRD